MGDVLWLLGVAPLDCRWFRWRPARMAADQAGGKARVCAALLDQVVPIQPAARTGAPGSAIVHAPPWGRHPDHTTPRATVMQNNPTPTEQADGSLTQPADENAPAADHLQDPAPAARCPTRRSPGTPCAGYGHTIMSGQKWRSAKLAPNRSWLSWPDRYFWRALKPCIKRSRSAAMRIDARSSI
ncbi:hypothetical protein D9M68_693640 [compost metagenome]